MLDSLGYWLWDAGGTVVWPSVARCGQKGALDSSTLRNVGWRKALCDNNDSSSYLLDSSWMLGCSANKFFIKAKILNLHPAVGLCEKSFNFFRSQLPHLRSGDNNSRTPWSCCEYNELMQLTGLGQPDEIGPQSVLLMFVAIIRSSTPFGGDHCCSHFPRTETWPKVVKPVGDAARRGVCVSDAGAWALRPHWVG